MSEPLVLVLNGIWRSVPILLHLFWIPATIAALLSLYPLPGLEGFRNAVLLSACRGKLWENRPITALGFLSDWKVPQKWFSHFYFIGILANAFSIYVSSQAPIKGQIHLLITLALLEFHLLRRFLETTLLMKYPAKASMHGIAYLFGILYYAVLPLTCLPKDIFGIPLIDHLGYSSWRESRQLMEHHVQHEFFLLGAAIFLSGNFLQYQSHWILAALSKSPRGSDYKIPAGKPFILYTLSYLWYCGLMMIHVHWKLKFLWHVVANIQRRYSITTPQSGLFGLVSCPHYLAEIIIYFGLGLQLDTSRPLSWLPLAWVVANLCLAADLTHKWYHRKFDNYPRSRYALVPWLY